MTSLADPGKVHEALAVALMLVLLPATFVAMRYVFTLGAFFKELQEKEPQVWQRVGAPRLAPMMFLPWRDTRQFFAFLPELRLRAASDTSGYIYARPAYVLFCWGIALAALLFVLAGATIAWMVYHGL